MLYARDSRKFKCVQDICRLLGGPWDHSQRSGLLQTSKPPEKAADGNPFINYISFYVVIFILFYFILTRNDIKDIKTQLKFSKCFALTRNLLEKAWQFVFDRNIK